jgi:alpha-galactosidase
MYTDAAKEKAILFSYNLLTRYREFFDRVKLQGLDASKSYRIKEINLLPGTKSAMACDNKVYRGDYLMTVGIDISGPKREAFTSAIFEIVAE